MKISVAKTAGFCFGVQRAVEEVYRQVEKNRKREQPLPIYTYGPIVHNESVVKDLEEKGVRVITESAALDDLERGIVIIRAHGVSRAVAELLQSKSLELIDMTCPFVKKIHCIVEEQSKAGRKIIIVGDHTHPEVQGIVGWSTTGSVVIENTEDLQKIHLTKAEKLCIVAQTTFRYKKFQDMVEKISKMRYDIIVLNTICNATRERQSEARTLASDSDVVLVIGGKNSSNTQKLFEICKSECAHTYFIQTVADVDPDWFASTDEIGITAGASTPHHIIEEVQTYVRSKF